MKLQGPSITIANRTISDSSPTYIIAEAGVNHNGSIETAKQLIDVAKRAGADAVKFQLFHVDELILEDVEKAPYQKRNEAQLSQYEMLKKLEITQEDCAELSNYCREMQIHFLATPFDNQSLQELLALGVDALKISSTDTTNIAFLEAAAKSRLPVILSTGMSFGNEVEIALETMQKHNKDIILLHCTSAYPFPESEANLGVINTFKAQYGLITGYSDHSVGIGVSPYAVACGAKVIEKHFTLDKKLDGPDHKASLEPDELLQFVSEIRRVDAMLGDGIKRVTLCEEENRRSMQKCIVASCPVEKGQRLSLNNIVAKRTGGKGIPAIHLPDLLGRRVSVALKTNDIIELSTVSECNN